MSADQGKAIWVFDAGMMEAGGHHAALAETLCQAKARQNHLTIRVFAHKLLDEQMGKRFVESGIATELSFDSVFYKHFHDGAVLGPAGLQKYIRVLSLEYKQLLERALKQSNQQRIIVFLPCLNWEHACALGYSINQMQFALSKADIHLVTCAMYSPIDTHQGHETKSIWYKMAFKSLVKHQFVSLYCSEQELSKAYGDLLSFEECFLHPCYLMDWIGASVHHIIEQETKVRKKNYLLYMGDAKVDKGFNRLPELLQQGLAATGPDVEFVIQFTLAWEYPEIMATVNTLINLGKTEPRLNIHRGFWSNQDMVSMIRKIDGAICTYDTNAYQYKSSGLIWMLAFFNKPLVISGSCWLSREAERLNVPLAINGALDVKCFSQMGVATSSVNTSYADRLFAPLFDWLLSH